jgi:pantoate--beta-alanine ligase
MGAAREWLSCVPLPVGEETAGGQSITMQRRKISPMLILHTTAELRAALAGQTPVLVPTMGNLHAGHMRLIERAVAEKAADRASVVVASLFVNRLQFLPHEDFDAYPRTLIADCEKLQAAGCDIAFAPSEAELYPEPQGFKVHPPAAMADILEGAFRPGFFTGVCTVVSKLFNLVQPRSAVFGKKDYQQLAVLRAMVRQMAMPIELIGVETERAEDGLALSSRNGYLTATQRQQALALSASLRWLIAQAQAGRRDWQALESEAIAALNAQGWQSDYLTIRQQSNLLPFLPNHGENAAQEAISLVALGASRLGATRLIDNLELTL